MFPCFPLVRYGPLWSADSPQMGNSFWSTWGWVAGLRLHLNRVSGLRISPDSGLLRPPLTPPICGPRLPGDCPATPARSGSTARWHRILWKARRRNSPRMELGAAWFVSGGRSFGCSKVSLVEFQGCPHFAWMLSGGQRASNSDNLLRSLAM